MCKKYFYCHLNSSIFHWTCNVKFSTTWLVYWYRTVFRASIVKSNGPHPPCGCQDGHFFLRLNKSWHRFFWETWKHWSKNSRAEILMFPSRSSQSPKHCYGSRATWQFERSVPSSATAYLRTPLISSSWKNKPTPAMVSGLKGPQSDVVHVSGYALSAIRLASSSRFDGVMVRV